MRTFFSLIKSGCLTAALICGVLCCAFAPVQAAQWGLLKHLEETVSDRESPADEGKDQYPFFAMYRYLTNQPISYSIQVDYGEGAQPDEITKQMHTSIFAQAIERNFNEWLNQTSDYILKQGRANDFKDILNIFRHTSLKLKQVKEGEDILFDFTTYQGGGVFYPHHDSKRLINIPNPFYLEESELGSGKNYSSQNNPEYTSRLNPLLLHEIGHYWGLSDRYTNNNGISLSSVEYSTSSDADSDAVMSKDGGKAGKVTLTCDDVDGFINLIDFNLAKINGNYSKRANEGWKGFCENRYYKQARQVNRPDHYRGLSVYSFHEDGRLKSEESAADPGTFFNPFAMEGVLNLPLNGTQQIVHPENNYYVLFDFNQLPEKHSFTVEVGIADRRLNFLEVQQQANTWYIKNQGANNHENVSFSGSDCYYQADNYGTFINNYRTKFPYPYTRQASQNSHTANIYQKRTYSHFNVRNNFNDQQKEEYIFTSVDNGESFSVINDREGRNSFLNKDEVKTDGFKMRIIDHIQFLSEQQEKNAKACYFFEKLKKAGF